ncbi:MAG: alpha/beta hydrolase-fold protein [Actinomycetaceae bacterium]|nr:alpha/beta hydrolase-fold protein [Actinomycetaceae bacterium]
MSLLSWWWPLGTTIATALFGILSALVLVRPAWKARFAGAVAMVLSASLAVLTVGLTSNLKMGFVENLDHVANLLAADDTPAKTVDHPALPPAEDGSLGEDTAPSSAPEWKLNFAPFFSPHTQQAPFTGPESKVESSITVWLPEDYSPTDGKTYSVIEFLHGLPGSAKGVVEALDWENTYRELIEAGTIGPTIFVMPDLLSSQGEPQCRDLQGQPQMETWVTRDVPKAIRSNFPNVSDKRADWVLAGISAGAYCSANLSLRYPQTYSAGLSFSGYDRPLLGPLSDSDTHTRLENTISAMAATLDHPAALYIAATESDPDAVEMLNNVAARARGHLRLATHVQSDGGHSWATWGKQLPAALAWWRGLPADGVKAGEDGSAPAKQPLAAVGGDDFVPVVAKTQGPFTLTGSGTVVAVWGLALLLAGFAIFTGGRGRRDFVDQETAPGLASSPRRESDVRLPSSPRREPAADLASSPRRESDPPREPAPARRWPSWLSPWWVLPRNLLTVAVAAITIAVAMLVTINADSAFFTSFSDLSSGWRTMFP